MNQVLIRVYLLRRRMPLKEVNRKSNRRIRAPVTLFIVHCFVGVGILVSQSLCIIICNKRAISEQAATNPYPACLTFIFWWANKNGLSCERHKLDSRKASYFLLNGSEGFTSVRRNLKLDCLNACLRGLQFNLTDKDMIGTYAEESANFMCNIKCNISFAYTRWNDGELDTLTGEKTKTRVRMTQVEGWTTGQNASNSAMLKADLLKSLLVRDRNFLYGFNYPSCGEGLVIQQLSGGGSWKWVSRFSRLPEFPPVNQLTYADLLSGRNYHYFGMKELLFQTAKKKNCAVLANKRAKRSTNIPWFDRISTFDSDLTGSWLEQRDHVVRDMIAMAKSKSSHTFLFALGPISNILIAHMWEANPNNTYVDVGSALNEFHGFGMRDRAYMRNPTCQALGPTCTPMRYKPNLMTGSSEAFKIKSSHVIDKLRCCTPIIPNCSLTLQRWYPPVQQKGNKRLTCKGILSKDFIVRHLVKLCRCGEKGSIQILSSCVAAPE